MNIFTFANNYNSAKMNKLILFCFIVVLAASCSKQEKLYTAEEVKYMMDSLVRNEVNKRLKEQEENFKMRNKVEIRAQVEKMMNKDDKEKSASEQDPVFTSLGKNTDHMDSSLNAANSKDRRERDSLPVKE